MSDPASLSDRSLLPVSTDTDDLDLEDLPELDDELHPLGEHLASPRANPAAANPTVANPAAAEFGTSPSPSVPSSAPLSIASFGVESKRSDPLTSSSGTSFSVPPFSVSVPHAGADPGALAGAAAPPTPFHGGHAGAAKVAQPIVFPGLVAAAAGFSTAGEPIRAGGCGRAAGFSTAGEPVRAGGCGRAAGFSTAGEPVRAGGCGRAAGFSTAGEPVQAGGCGYCGLELVLVGVGGLSATEVQSAGDLFGAFDGITVHVEAPSDAKSEAKAGCAIDEGLAAALQRWINWGPKGRTGAVGEGAMAGGHAGLRCLVGSGKSWYSAVFERGSAFKPCGHRFRGSSASGADEADARPFSAAKSCGGAVLVVNGGSKYGLGAAGRLLPCVRQLVRHAVSADLDRCSPWQQWLDLSAAVTVGFKPDGKKLDVARFYRTLAWRDAPPSGRLRICALQAVVLTHAKMQATPSSFWQRALEIQKSPALDNEARDALLALLAPALFDPAAPVLPE